MVVLLAAFGDAFAIVTASLAPTIDLRAVSGSFSTDDFRIRHTDILGNVMVFLTGGEMT